MTQKIRKVALIFFLFLTSGCSLIGKTEPLPTLDATNIYQTSVVQSTAAHLQTLTPQALTSTAQAIALTAAVTPTSIPTIDRTRPVDQTPGKTNDCDIALAGSPLDVSIRDYEKLSPGQSFTKTWRLVNAGTCKWTRLYQVVFFSSNSMSAQYNHNLNGEVLPGRSVDLSVSMTAPSEPGIYQGNWMLQNEAGGLFGIGPNGDAPFWVIIEVVQQLTPTPTATITPTLTPTKTFTIFSQGTLLLESALRYDLDQGELASPATVWDMEYASVDGNFSFQPGDGAGLVSFGANGPLASDCQRQTFSNTPIVFNTFPGSHYFCYRTDAGRLGRLHLLEYDTASGIITAEFLTWALP